MEADTWCVSLETMTLFSAIPKIINVLCYQKLVYDLEVFNKALIPVT